MTNSHRGDEGPLRLLVCTPDGDGGEDVHPFAEHVAELLAARLASVHSLQSVLNACAASHDEDYDLIVLGDGEATQGPIERFVFSPVVRRLVQQVSSSLLLMQMPHWPLRHMLLVVRGEHTDEAAVRWCLRLAEPSRSRVTILVMLPLETTRQLHVQSSLSAALKAETRLGQQVRRIARQFAARGIECALAMRGGPPDWQIRQTTAGADYDLIVIPSDADGPPAHWLLGGLIGPLLRAVNRPVLIARSPREDAEESEAGRESHYVE